MIRDINLPVLVQSSSDFAMFNVQYYITKLEDGTEYNFPFTRIKQVEKQLDEMAGDDEEKKEEEEKKTEEITDENEKAAAHAQKLVDKLKKPGKSIDLETIEEGDLGESNAQEGERQLLRGFRDTKVKIHLLGTQDLRTLNTRRKFQGLFDIGVMSIHSADKISPELTKMFKDKARVHCESADYLIVMKPEQKEEFRAKVLEKADEASWALQDQPPYQHHMLFEVNNPEANNLPPMEDSDSSDFDL